MRLLFCSPADSKVLCGFIVSFLAPTVADRQRALCYTSWPPLLSCKCFIISVFPTLDFNWLCDSLLVLLRLFTIRTGSLLSGFIRLLMPLVFQRGFLFSSISTFWRSIARLATCRFIFFHFFHSYTLIIRYDLPPDPWSDLPKVLLYFFLFLFCFSVRFSVVFCWVLFHFYWRLA